MVSYFTSEAFFQLVVLDAPEHEDDWGDDREDEGVGEVAVERQFDQVATKTKGPGGLNERGKDPPTNGTKTVLINVKNFEGFEKLQYCYFAQSNNWG